MTSRCPQAFFLECSLLSVKANQGSFFLLMAKNEEGVSTFGAVDIFSTSATMLNWLLPEIFIQKEAMRCMPTRII
jgi:hypothetical protein